MKPKNLETETCKLLVSISPARESERGFSLIEMVVTMAILSIGIMGLSAIVNLSMRDDKAINASFARTNLGATLRKALTHRKSLRNTILNNPVMKAAVTGTPADYAAAGGYFYADNRPYGIEIYDTENQVLAGKGADAFGGAAAPAYYTTSGSRCSTPGTGNCLFSVTATLHIQGEAKYGTPDNMIPHPTYPAWHPTFKPDFMMVVYSIETLATPTSTNIQRKPLAGSVFVSVEDVQGLVP